MSKRCDSISIESFESNLLNQVGKQVNPARIDSLYNSGYCYLDCVSLVLNEYISSTRIMKLNKILLHTLNSSIAKFGVKDNITALQFTDNFFEKEKCLVLLKLKTIKEGIKQSKEINYEVLSKLNDTIKIAEGLNTIEDLKTITNE